MYSMQQRKRQRQSKKRRQSWFQRYLLQLVGKSLQSALEEAMKEILEPLQQGLIK